MIRMEERHEDPQITLAPLVDVILFVIVFFLVATSFNERERDQDVLLPSNANPRSLSRDYDRNFVINVLLDGTVRVHGEKTNDRDLVARLRERRESASQPFKVMVRADRRTAYGNVATVLAAVERAGIQRPFVVTRLVDIEG